RRRREWRSARYRAKRDVGHIVMHTPAVGESGDVSAEQSEPVDRTDRRDWDGDIQSEIFVRLTIGKERRVIWTSDGIHGNPRSEYRDEIVSRRCGNVDPEDQLHKSSKLRIKYERCRDRIVDGRQRVERVLQSERNDDLIHQWITETRNLTPRTRVNYLTWINDTGRAATRGRPD